MSGSTPAAQADRALEFSGSEVGDERVVDDTVAAALHPPGLTGVDHLGPNAATVEFVGQEPGGGAFADDAVGAQHRNPFGPHRIHRTVPEPQIAGRWCAADVGDADSLGRAEFSQFRLVAQVVVQPAHQIQSGLGAFHQLGA